MYKHYFKRIFDFIFALFGFLTLLPLFVVITISLYVANQGKPFFSQKRPGKNAKIFKIVKFRTMNDRKDKAGQLLPDVERLTLLGRLVRRTSLDEMPQLLNVIIGDMSLIGPRPLLPEYLPLYNEKQQRRHEIRPGITGWAQVNGRNTISWKEKFELDVWYVDNISFIIDLKILLLTLVKVFKSEGVSPNDSILMEVFKGNESNK
ncbi:MAG: sugar transferase [Daejeonella sp.]|uniref:sugar transferase n=1 Tax=Daejeonella sp. TaxID=2805397 RepID=UPI002735E31B|nr:sugar transferase [Daejeonella sp.]MDP3467507.1 sugar transferase [Daejeonella sp.]